MRKFLLGAFAAAMTAGIVAPAAAQVVVVRPPVVVHRRPVVVVRRPAPVVVVHPRRRHRVNVCVVSYHVRRCHWEWRYY
jgi:hypothetical protein